MKIFDCFMYFDEDLLLDLRLNILNDFVDKFIIIESNLTHTGKFKKLKFDINKFENATTLVRATHITNVTDKLLVTASAEQIPKICNVIGFSSIRGLTKTCLYALRFII